MRNVHGLLLRVALGASLLAASSDSARAQGVRIRDLVLSDAAPSVRLMGYGLVVGLNGTGDRVTGTYGSRQTVQSIVNLLRRFDVEVPAEVLRTRNVAAVLVTAEVSPFLRSTGHFAVRVSSIGDAQSLRGGVLWMTPLVVEAGGKPVASAQGSLIVNANGLTSGGGGGGYQSNSSNPYQNTNGFGYPSFSGGGGGGGGNQNGPVTTTAMLPDGGILEADLPRPAISVSSKLLLREPDISTATRIAAAIDSVLGGPGQTHVDDPGAISLALKDTSRSLLATLAHIGEIPVKPARAARLIIDGRDGTIVAGGDLVVGEAVVSHEGITLSIGGGVAPSDSTAVAGDVRVAPGTSVQKIASALHVMQARPAEIAAIFEALREVGAIAAEVVVR